MYNHHAGFDCTEPLARRGAPSSDASKLLKTTSFRGLITPEQGVILGFPKPGHRHTQSGTAWTTSNHMGTTDVCDRVDSLSADGIAEPSFSAPLLTSRRAANGMRASFPSADDDRSIHIGGGSRGVTFGVSSTAHGHSGAGSSMVMFLVPPAHGAAMSANSLRVTSFSDGQSTRGGNAYAASTPVATAYQAAASSLARPAGWERPVSEGSGAASRALLYKSMNGGTGNGALPVVEMELCSKRSSLTGAAAANARQRAVGLVGRVVVELPVQHAGGPLMAGAHILRSAN